MGGCVDDEMYNGIAVINIIIITTMNITCYNYEVAFFILNKFKI